MSSSLASFFYLPTMITVDYVLRNYCKNLNLPEPTKEDFEHCGRMISHHFKRFWGINLPDGLIPNSGFIKVSSENGPMIIQAYPIEFEPEMHKRIAVYYSKKEIPKVEEKKVRKRIPTKKPAASFKPSKVGG